MPFWFLEDLKTTTTVKVWPFLADFSYNEQEKFSSINCQMLRSQLKENEAGKQF